MEIWNRQKEMEAARGKVSRDVESPEDSPWTPVII